MAVVLACENGIGLTDLSLYQLVVFILVLRFGDQKCVPENSKLSRVGFVVEGGDLVLLEVASG